MKGAASPLHPYAGSIPVWVRPALSSRRGDPSTRRGWAGSLLLSPQRGDPPPVPVRPAAGGLPPEWLSCTRSSPQTGRRSYPLPCYLPDRVCG